MIKKPQGKLLFDPPDFIESNSRQSKRSDFEFQKKLGDGSYSHVWRVKHKRTNRFFAIKQVPKIKVFSTLAQFRREVEILYKVSHPHIIKLFSHFEDDKFFYLIMELMEGGTLFHKLYREKYFNEHVAAQFFREIVLAVEFLHSQDPAIVHRDIKPENIMVDKDMRIKLIDFGWATFVEPAKLRMTYCGTSEYMSPEIVNNKGHSLAIDLWCIGILLYEMLTGTTPFKSTDQSALYKMITDGKVKFPDRVPARARVLIMKLLDKDPFSRASIIEAKNSEWLQNIPAIRKTIKQVMSKPKVNIKLNYSYDVHDTGSSGSDDESSFFVLSKNEQEIKENIAKEQRNFIEIRKKIELTEQEISLFVNKTLVLEKTIFQKRMEIFEINKSKKDILSKDFNLKLELARLKGHDLNDLYEKKIQTKSELLEVNQECKVKKSILENLLKKVEKESILYFNYENQLQKLKSSLKSLQTQKNGENLQVSEHLRSKIDQLKHELGKPEQSQTLTCDLNQAHEICEFIQTRIHKNEDFSGEIQQKLSSLDLKTQELENSIQELRIVNELRKYSVMQSFQMKKTKILSKCQIFAERMQKEYKKNIEIQRQNIESQLAMISKDTTADMIDYEHLLGRVKVRNI